MDIGDRVVVDLNECHGEEDGARLIFEAVVTGRQPHALIVKPVLWLEWMERYRNPALDPDEQMVVPEIVARKG